MILSAEQELDELEMMTQGHHETNEFYGDPLEEEPDNNTTRIYIQNLNGLSWDKDGGKWQYICEVLDSIQADIACFSELNTDTTNYSIRRKMESICQHQFVQNSLIMATSRTKSITSYKPGGTAILARNQITSNIKSYTRDRMGRWASLCLTTANARKIRVISAYQVCHNARPGHNTASTQQRAQIMEEGALAERPDRRTPRQAFIQDLQAFITHLQTEGEEVILAGDFNEELSAPMSGMDRLATSCKLVDLFSVRTGASTLPATYQRGTKRIDYILISPQLLPHVKAAGYDPFGYRLPSDHRGMYVDFDTATLFQQTLTALNPIDRRDFITTNPEVIRTYVTAKMKYLQEHRFFERLTDLDESMAPQHDLAEALDRDFQRAATHAAHKCTKKKRTPWSPKLAEAWAELHFYRIARSALTTSADYKPAIARLQAQWPNLPGEIPNNLEDIHNRYQESVKKLKSVRQMAQKLRDEFLVRRLELYKALEEQGKAKILQRLIRAESQHKVYTKIKYLRHQDSATTGLSKLKIPKNVPLENTAEIKKLPDTPDHWETITAPEEIERLLLNRNRMHFSQAEGTPFTQPPLSVDIGYNADGYAADLVLAGQIDYTTTSAATTLLIKHLQARTATTLEGTITKEEVLGKLKSWRESTSTSPSGIHLGHYHCMWRNPQMHPDDPDYEKVKEYQTYLLHATVSLLNYALRFSYTYKRWTKVVNVMLLKDPGNPRIHRLRVIHLYEADYNLLLATKWRQALHFAEDNHLLNDGLYGSRPGRSAHDPALIETLQNEMYRTSMKSGINFDLDATSCYDRILTSVAAISCRRIGMAKQVVQLNTSTLQKIHYHLKTNLGISQGYYCHSASTPVHGTGQGSGNSPSIWCFVCSSLFDAFSSSAHGATFASYDNTSKITLHMVGFVDDCSQRVNKFLHHDQPSYDHLLQVMASDAQLWNDLLWASGGALEQSKCSFHLIQTDWTNDGHPFLKGNTENKPIHLDHNGIRTPTYQISNYTSHKTLGCYINPAYSNIQAWRAIRSKNEQFAVLLETNFFSRSEAWTFYTSIYLPSITYPLPITPLTYTQCEQIDTRFLRTLLPRCGFNRNMPRAVRYAPLHLGGAGFKQIYVEQGILLLQQAFKFLNSPDTTIGKLLLMTISWTQAFIGTSKLFLTDVEHPIPPASPSWLLDLRTFLQRVQGSLQLQNPPLPKLLRQQDRFIMDIAMSQRTWTQRHLKQINSCRRYLQAQSLADISTLSGTRIQSYALTGTNLPSPDSIRISTFNQKRPGPAAWTTWKKFLTKISDSLGVLHQPLGDWTVDVSGTRHWPSRVYDAANDQLYSHAYGSLYHMHHRISPGIFSPSVGTAPVSARGYPTAVKMTMNTLRPTCNYIDNNEHNPELPVVICDTLTNTPPWEHELLQHCTDITEVTIIKQQLMSGGIVTCSDGSATTTRGSFGFIISTTAGLRLAKGHGPAPGAYPNSFRSEAYGVLATLRWLHQAFIMYPPTDTYTITHYLDNKSVIHRIKHSRGYHHQAPNRRLLSEQDVIDAIILTLQYLPVTIKFEWVQGHQNTTTDYTRLPLPAQLNCDADSEATSYSPIPMSNYSTITTLPSTPCQLFINQKPITAHIKRRIREATTITNLHTYLKSKFDWDDETLSLIDWTTYEHIIKIYKEKRTTLVKHLHAISPTGHIAHRNDRHLPHECPACNEPFENNTHVLLCKHPKHSSDSKRQLACPISAILIAMSTQFTVQDKAAVTPRTYGCSFLLHCLTSIPNKHLEPRLFPLVVN